MKKLLSFFLLLPLIALGQIAPDYIRHPASLPCGSNTFVQTLGSTSATQATCAQPSFTTLSGALACSQLPTFTGDMTNVLCALTIANNAVTTAKINNSAVTLAKIANAAANSKLLGSGVSGSGSPYSELSIGTNLSMSGTTLNATGGAASPLTTKGDIWGFSSVDARIPIGSNGQVLVADSTQTLGLAYKTVTGITGPTGTGFVETTSGTINSAATTFAAAAIQVSSFNLTGLTIPLAANFTNANGGSATFATADKSNRMQVSMTGSSNGGTTIAVATQNAALISTPYTIDIGFVTTFPPGSTGALTGIFLSDGTKYLAFYAGVSSGAGKIFIDSYTVRTSGTVVNKLNINTATVSQPIWLRITDSGTTRQYLISPNGQDYTVAFSEPTNTFLTPTATGICQFYTGGQSVKVAVQHYLVSNSVLGDGS